MQTQGEISYPLTHATVVRVISKMPVPSPESLKKKGTLVRIRQGCKFFGLDPEASGTGEVIGSKDDEPGWTYVRFGNSFKNRYRVGTPAVDDGACDLELDSRETQAYAVVNYGGQLIEAPITGFTVEPGDIVKFSRDPLRVVEVEKCVASGDIAFVTQIMDGGIALVDYKGGRRTVFAGKFAGKLEENGRVVLDASGSVIIDNFGLDDDAFAVDEKSLETVTWEDICGQEEAKNRLRDALEKPAQFPTHYKFFGRRQPHGGLLYGPPGCSKSMFGKAIYQSMIRTCRAKDLKTSQGFIFVSGPAVLDKYVGVSEATIRHIFAKARKFYARTGVKALIFVDECEAILAKRESGISSDVLRTIVPAWIAEAQGIQESGAIVILATNKPEMLDDAVIREGRVDFKILIGRPDRKAAREIFVKNMVKQKIPVSETTDMDKLADLFVSELFSPARKIYEITRRNADGQDEQVSFTLADIVSGAMVPAIVEEAQRLALERELQKAEPSEGIRPEDVTAGVESIYRQNSASDHETALRDFTHDFADKVCGVRKLVQAQR